jgi:hypothetical protein
MVMISFKNWLAINNAVRSQTDGQITDTWHSARWGLDDELRKAALVAVEEMLRQLEAKLDSGNSPPRIGDDLTDFEALRDLLRKG